MKNSFVFPEPKNENQRKLFQQLQWCCNAYDQDFHRGFRKKYLLDQAYGMVILYNVLFPEEYSVIDLWNHHLRDYLSR